MMSSVTYLQTYSLNYFLQPVSTIHMTVYFVFTAYLIVCSLTNNSYFHYFGYFAWVKNQIYQKQA